MRISGYEVRAESWLKCMVLTKGVRFSDAALRLAEKVSAKQQNLVYNMPLNATVSRPQEIMIRSADDGYAVVGSCVSPCDENNAVLLDVDECGCLIASFEGRRIDGVELTYVGEPSFYRRTLSDGESVRKYVSACGLDELNVLPWKGCAISRMCRFCGANSFAGDGALSALSIGKDPESWFRQEGSYLSHLKEAVSIALDSDCYREHVHVILIAGNLRNDQLDLESRIFARIAKAIEPLVRERAAEGIVLVVSPPEDEGLLAELKEAGVGKIVFNMEAVGLECFRRNCPGKADLGYDYFQKRLCSAVRVFGRGNVWSNLVFGLEPAKEALERIKDFAEQGVVMSANVLHLDKGNTLECEVPSPEEVMAFFYGMEEINHQYGYRPYYCAKALRTSLSNEVHDGRVRRV